MRWTNWQPKWPANPKLYLRDVCGLYGASELVLFLLLLRFQNMYFFYVSAQISGHFAQIVGQINRLS